MIMKLWIIDDWEHEVTPDVPAVCKGVVRVADVSERPVAAPPGAEPPTGRQPGVCRSDQPGEPAKVYSIRNWSSRKDSRSILYVDHGMVLLSPKNTRGSIKSRTKLRRTYPNWEIAFACRLSIGQSESAFLPLHESSGQCRMTPFYYSSNHTTESMFGECPKKLNSV